MSNEEFQKLVLEKLLSLYSGQKKLVEGQAELKEEIEEAPGRSRSHKRRARATKAELKEEIASVKAELKADIAKLNKGISDVVAE